MSISARLKGLLDENKIPYSVMTHETAYSTRRDLWALLDRLFCRASLSEIIPLVMTAGDDPTQNQGFRPLADGSSLIQGQAHEMSYRG
jgi:hypothetical protein